MGKNEKLSEQWHRLCWTLVLTDIGSVVDSLVRIKTCMYPVKCNENAPHSLLTNGVKYFNEVEKEHWLHSFLLKLLDSKNISSVLLSGTKPHRSWGTALWSQEGRSQRGSWYCLSLLQVAVWTHMLLLLNFIPFLLSLRIITSPMIPDIFFSYMVVAVRL